MAEKMDLNEKLRILMEDKECVDLSKTFTDMQMIKVVVLKTLLLESLEYAAENRGVTKIRNLPKLHNGETHEYHLTKDHVRFVLRFISGSLKGESVNFQVKFFVILSSTTLGFVHDCLFTSDNDYSHSTRSLK